MGLIERLGLPPVPPRHRPAAPRSYGRSAVPTAAAAHETAQAGAGAATFVGDESAPNIRPDKVTVGDVGLERVPGGLKVGVKGPSLLPKDLKGALAYRRTFNTQIPLFISGEFDINLVADLTVASALAGSIGLQVKCSAQGGVGLAEKDIKIAGPGIELACVTDCKVAYSHSTARGFETDSIDVVVYGTASLLLFVVDGGPAKFKIEKKLARADLFTLSIGPWQNGRFAWLRAEPGPDLVALVEEVGSWGGSVKAAARTGVADTARSLGNAVRQRTEQDIAREAMQLRRLQEAERRAELALQRANEVGNPLDRDTGATPGSPAREAWRQAMLQFWQPGVRARQQMASLQGDERIAKALEAEALLVQARAAFQAGRALLR